MRAQVLLDASPHLPSDVSHTPPPCNAILSVYAIDPKLVLNPEKLKVRPSVTEPLSDAAACFGHLD